MEANEILKKLQEPFVPEEIEWRVGATNQEKTKGIALAYVTNRAVQNRLDEVFGVFGWKNEFKEWKGKSQLCGISVKVGDEWITKWDGADDSDTEAVKGGLSDSMKRAAYQWGIGRYLYNLENVWVEITPAGKSYRLKSEPRLPQWALPEGYSYGGKPEPKQQEQPEQQHQDIPPPVLKAKYQHYTGSLNGFEDWVKSQQAKKRNYKDMEQILTDGILKKKESESA